MKTLILAISVIASLMGSAAHAYPPRIVTVTGRGSGGTTNGDRSAACWRAEDRALYAVASSCSNMRGNLVSSYAQQCNCHKKPGSKDDYNCDVNAVGRCEIGGRY